MEELSAPYALPPAVQAQMAANIQRCLEIGNAPVVPYDNEAKQEAFRKRMRHRPGQTDLAAQLVANGAASKEAMALVEASSRERAAIEAAYAAAIDGFTAQQTKQLANFRARMRHGPAFNQAAAPTTDKAFLLRVLMLMETGYNERDGRWFGP